MPATKPTRPHGSGVRGATLPRNSLFFEGRFGRLFRTLPPGDYGDDDDASIAALTLLGAKMVSVPDSADPKDGPDNEESGIPAVYTYFGQFIDHDLTFDPASFLQKQNDPDALLDYRTPAFDLDNVYGRGPDDQPYLYEDGRLFILGEPLTGAAANPNAKDLPRSQPSGPSNPARAIIGDPRNDENVIVSQLQGLFHRFHNHVATNHPGWTFEQVQREVRFHYQWVILHDFLPTLISHAALSVVWPHGTPLHKPVLTYFHWRDAPYMPLEFSAAAYRFGHSMVRPGYRLSETVPPLSIFATDPLKALTGFRKFPPNWAFDWNLFAYLEPRDKSNATRTQLAYKIDTSIVNPLGSLPLAVAGNLPLSLAARNLLRGWRMRLPTGQSVARAMGLHPLADAEILIGKFTGDAADILGPITTVAGPAFADNCPLWTYVLAETVEVPVTLATTGGDITIKSRKLGPVGGRIVAETFAGLMIGDSKSYLAQDPLWQPSLAVNGKFGLRDLIKTALS
jgi:hypothetical protein